MSGVISEDALSYLLDSAAADLEVPAQGAERVLAGVQPPQRRGRRVRPGLLVAAGVVVLATATAGVALTGGPGGAPLSLPAASGPALRGPTGAAATSGGVKSLTEHLGVAVPGAPQVNGAQGSAPTLTPGGPVVPPLTPRVVKTGVVNLQVPARSIGSAIARAQGLAAGLGGFVQDSSSSQAGAHPTATLTLRVPVAHFDTLVNDARGLGRVISLVESGQDVTSQYVDLGARIKALDASRATYLAILAKATTIGDVLAIQQQVNTVQQQIDQLRGQLQVLASQSDFSTVTVAFNTPGPPPPQARSGLSRAFAASVHGFVVAFEDLIAALGPLLFVLLCLGGLGLLARFAWRVTRRRLV